MHLVALIAAVIFLASALPPASGDPIESRVRLPPPGDIDMPLEQAICRRMSVRAFTDEPVSEQELSTVLWHAYGATGTGRAIHPVAATYGLQVYVLREDGAYRYDPGSHSLKLHRRGDYRRLGQYDTAPVKLGIVWDRQRCTSQNVAGANVGQVGQNVYFAANALGLGTVTTASQVGQLRLIGLPIKITVRKIRESVCYVTA
ncbi:MAG: nitroreductase family protein [Thermoplasmatota archaeon]